MYACMYVCEPKGHLGEDESRPTVAIRTWLTTEAVLPKKKKKKKKICDVRGLFLSCHRRTTVRKQLVSFRHVWLTFYLMFKPGGLKATGDVTN